MTGSELIVNLKTVAAMNSGHEDRLVLGIVVSPPTSRHPV